MPILFLIVFVDLVGFGLIIPLLPFYAERFGASPQQVTILMAVFSLMAMLAAPLWGRVSDRIGRRPVLMASMLASSLAYLWMGFADVLWMLFAARAFAGLCAGNIAAAQAYIADVTPPEKRARGMGMIGAAFGLGFIIGPALGGLVAGDNIGTADLESPGLIAAGLSFAAFLGVVLLLPESLPAATRARPRRSRLAVFQVALGRPVLPRLLAVFFLVILAFAGMESTFALWAMRQYDWGPAQIGYIFTFVGLLSAAMQGGLIGPLTRRFGEERLLLGGLALIALGLLVLPFARALAPLGVAVSALAIGMGAMQPSLNSLISRRAGAEEQGEIMGLSQSVGSLSRVLGPVIAGALFEAFGRSSPFLWGAVLVAGALLLSWPLHRLTVRGAAHAPPGSRVGPAE
ncbi:MAG: MFS transporter [Alphaproteobacteria bacterium]|nr:MFS transporter [Alphaproteobacteria bacterium]MBV9152047.1 MFS transporter [Alphaproteobacteria bacterium]MBV9967097.1 MFS transporter [Alphaproteobacteria bacterium]